MIKRTIFNSLKKHLASPEITVLIGPRQVGKTTLMRILQKSLEEKKEKTIFLNLDIDTHRPFFKSQSSLIDYIRLQNGNAKTYVFIDEIQRKENAGLFLKGIYDQDLPYKFIVSGSGSLDLKAKIKESMAGRKHLFTVDPVSFVEFVNFKTEYKYENRLNEFFNVEKPKTQSFLSEYMTFGGYPKVVLAEEINNKKNEMEEIYRSYIEKDITYLLDVEKPEAFANLLRIIASQIGGLVNIKELSSTIGIAEKTVAHYLWYLEETFILKKVTPYHRNVRSEITKSPVYYFYDTGFRNYLLGLFNYPQIPSSLSGHLFENVIFNILRSVLNAPSSIHFWRSRDHAEVDFVIESAGGVTPIEAKYKTLQKPEISRSYRSFLKRYAPKNAYVAHLGKESKMRIAKTSINLIPYHELLNLQKLIEPF